MYAVIIPTRNRLDCLKEAVQSVLDQTVPATEIIVIDDASDDQRGGEWLRELGDARIRYVYNETSRGGSGARNQGLDLVSAGAAYVAFLDDDDIWLKNKMEWQIAYLESDPESVAVSCHWEKFGEASGFRKIPTELAERVKDYENFFGSFSFLTVRWGIASAVRMTPGLLACQDWDYIYKLCELGHVHILPEVLCLYRVHLMPRITNNQEGRAAGMLGFGESNNLPPHARKWLRHRATGLRMPRPVSFGNLLAHSMQSLGHRVPLTIKIRYVASLWKENFKNYARTLLRSLKRRPSLTSA